ncbi:MAG: phosphoribosylformylglycinamidine synthase subunit PurQ [Polyangiaceae bacterium]|nr:phosphoribosylformylglycinamidine synthase subunit PurQ [Polyangiaceae bacterium]
MRAAVVVFPGSNADSEMLATLRLAGFLAVSVWHKETALPSPVDLVALPGGFSYGDYLRCGAICRASPILPAIQAHAARGGLVLGVCNGFQILTEVGLLPGALTRNAHLRFECSDVWVTPTGDSAFTRGLPRVLSLPIAHAEGRYQADHETLARLEDEGRIALRYCDAHGTPSDRGPNGSVRGIAGVIGGPSRNILGLMPHPERRSEALHGGADGKLLFDAARASLLAGVAA